MRSKLFTVLAATILFANSAQAECFNRNTCDPDALEVRSQLTVNVPVPDQASPAEAMQVMDEARRQLTSIALHECDTLKTSFNRDCTLTSVNSSSNLQERGGTHKVAYISISNGYQLKRPSK